MLSSVVRRRVVVVMDIVDIFFKNPPLWSQQQRSDILQISNFWSVCVPKSAEILSLSLLTPLSLLSPPAEIAASVPPPSCSWPSPSPPLRGGRHAGPQGRRRWGWRIQFFKLNMSGAGEGFSWEIGVCAREMKNNITLIGCAKTLFPRLRIVAKIALIDGNYV